MKHFVLSLITAYLVLFSSFSFAVTSGRLVYSVPDSVNCINFSPTTNKAAGLSFQFGIHLVNLSTTDVYVKITTLPGSGRNLTVRKPGSPTNNDYGFLSIANKSSERIKVPAGGEVTGVQTSLFCNTNGACGGTVLNKSWTSKSDGTQPSVIQDATVVWGSAIFAVKIEVEGNQGALIGRIQPVCARSFGEFQENTSSLAGSLINGGRPF